MFVAGAGFLCRFLEGEVRGFCFVAFPIPYIFRGRCWRMEDGQVMVTVMVLGLLGHGVRLCHGHVLRLCRLG